MRRLILLRHAKSSWSEPFQADHDRPLNGRGRNAADAMGLWLAEQGILPDQVLCSTSARTVETFARISAVWPGLPEPGLRDDLFHADLNTLYKAVRAATGHTLMVIGHNPGIAGFASDLVATPPEHPKFSQFPTAATLLVGFAIDDWSALHRGNGRVLGFAVPKDVASGPESD